MVSANILIMSTLTPLSYDRLCLVFQGWRVGQNTYTRNTTNDGIARFRISEEGLANDVHAELDKWVARKFGSSPVSPRLFRWIMHQHTQERRTNLKNLVR